MLARVFPPFVKWLETIHKWMFFPSSTGAVKKSCEIWLEEKEPD